MSGCRLRISPTSRSAVPEARPARKRFRIPGIRVDPRVGVRGTLEPDAAAVLLAIPAQALREVATKLQVVPATPVIACAKGIEQHTLAFMTDVIAETLPDALRARRSIGRGIAGALAFRNLSEVDLGHGRHARRRR